MLFCLPSHIPSLQNPLHSRIFPLPSLEHSNTCSISLLSLFYPIIQPPDPLYYLLSFPALSLLVYISSSQTPPSTTGVMMRYEIINQKMNIRIIVLYPMTRRCRIIVMAIAMKIGRESMMPLSS